MTTTMRQVADYVLAAASKLGGQMASTSVEVDEAERMVGFGDGFIWLAEEPIQVPSLGGMIDTTAWILTNNDGDPIRDHPPYRTIAQATQALLLEMVSELIGLDLEYQLQPGEEPEPVPTGRCVCGRDLYANDGIECGICAAEQELEGLKLLRDGGASMSHAAHLRVDAYEARLAAETGAAGDFAFDAARERRLA